MLARLALLVALALAGGLRLFRIDAQSLWYDEGISAHQLTRSFSEIAWAAAHDTHPPLYYWTLKAWASLFGASELGLRSLSAVFGVAAVALVWLIGRRLFGSRPAWLAAALLACSPLAVYYSQETRMYAQVTALGLLAAWAYLGRRYLVYALAATATLYSQYLGVALLAALHLHALVWRRQDWRKWLAADAAVGLVFLPWLPTVLDQMANRALNTSPRTAGGLVEATLAALGEGIAHGELALLGGGLLVGLALVGLALGDRFGTSLALLLWLVPLALVEALGIRTGLFELRYLVLAVPGLALLAGLGVERLASLSGRPLAPATVAALGLLVLAPAADGLERMYFDPSLARDDYRGLAQTIARAAQPTDAVILSSPNQDEVFAYYFRGSVPVYPLPAQRPIDPDDTRRRLEAIRAEHPRVWLVAWAMADADPRGVIDTWLAQNGFEASHQWFGGLQLALIGLAGPTSQPTESLDAPLDNGITLDGYRIGSRTPRPGETLPLTLVWQAGRPPAARWKVFTHLLDAHQQVVAQRDSEPQDGLRPTTTWQPGERIEDNYGLALPADLPPGSYALEVGMYQGDLRATFVGRGDHLVLTHVDVR